MEAFKSTDDKRIENSGTRSKYRTLTEAEKNTIDEIKRSGDITIDVFRELKNLKPD